MHNFPEKKKIKFKIRMKAVNKVCDDLFVSKDLAFMIESGQILNWRGILCHCMWLLGISFKEIKWKMKVLSCSRGQIWACLHQSDCYSGIFGRIRPRTSDPCFCSQTRCRLHSEAWLRACLAVMCTQLEHFELLQLSDSSKVLCLNLQSASFMKLGWRL